MATLINQATMIIGASGLLGRAMHRHLAPHALGTYHLRARPGLLPLDVRDPHAIHQLLRDTRPEVVINAAGERRPAVWAADPDRTRVLMSTCSTLSPTRPGLRPGRVLDTPGLGTLTRSRTRQRMVATCFSAPV